MSGGYPKSVFVAMNIVATLCILSAAVMGMAMSIPMHCGWSGDTFYYQYITFIDGEDYGIYFVIEMTMYLSWDLTTLMLFVWKPVSF